MNSKKLTPPPTGKLKRTEPSLIADNNTADAREVVPPDEDRPRKTEAGFTVS